jgi:hypothetical protein
MNKKVLTNFFVIFRVNAVRDVTYLRAAVCIVSPLGDSHKKRVAQERKKYEKEQRRDNGKQTMNVNCSI